MSRVTGANAKRCPRIVFLCNIREAIDREEVGQYHRSSVEFAVALLRESGFNSILDTVLRRYSRPLVRGTRPIQVTR